MRDFVTGQFKTLKGRLATLFPKKEEPLAELATYRHAYQTTAMDRDAWRQRYENERRALDGTLAMSGKIANFMEGKSGSLAPPILADGVLEAFDKLAGEHGASSRLAVARPEAPSAAWRVPNLYCVGAPKSVTSFFYSVLREHSKVFVCNKDTGELIDLNLALQHGSSFALSEACKFLAAANRNSTGSYSGQPVMGVFDVGYFQHDGGAQLIKQHLHSDAKILFFLRDPVKRLISEYVMRLRQHDPLVGGFVEIHDFSEALKREASRLRDDGVLAKQYYGYVANSQYHQTLQTYFDAFGPENVKVVIAEEDVYDNLSPTILDVFGFLGVRDAEAVRIAFRDHGRYASMSGTPKDIRITFTLRDDRQVDDAALHEDLIARGVKRLEIWSDVPMQLELDLATPSLRDIEAARALRRRHALKLSPAEEGRLFEQHFRRDVEGLEKLLKRDLSCWTKRHATP